QGTAPRCPPQRNRVFCRPEGHAWLRTRLIGSDPKSFQWRFRGADLPGETNAVLKLGNLAADRVGLYSVVVSNVFGMNVSSDIELKLTRVRRVIHISADALGGRYLE